jgi:superfamily II DNA or RNA helicase
MLGLSATPNRKDGLTKVLKWYVGDMIHTVKSFDKNVVKVERYLLESSFTGYNEDVLNFRGKPQMATMVNNIANYGKRTEYMMKIILESLAGFEKRQILVLSDRKQNLADMHKIAIQKGMTSVGYYIGGMKKDDLKKSESCRLLLGTFAMAKEGLDIPTLNGLVLACPKSDIIQAIGRIDRVVHEGIQPIIIDVVDQFSVFESQARKRFQVFKKKKHQIEDIVVNLETGFIKSRQSYNFHNMPCLQDKEDDDQDREDNEQQQIDFKDEEDGANEDFEDDFEIDFDNTKNNSNKTNNNNSTKPRECMFDVEGSFPIEKSDKIYPPRKFNKPYSKPKTSSDETTQKPTNNKSSYPTKRRVPYKKNVADMTTQERTQFVEKMFERINAFTD